MPHIRANNIDIEVEEHGRKGDPAVLLVMGLAAQLTLWPAAFIDALTSAGFRVIRFDNRDVGLSQKLHTHRAPNPAFMAAAVRLFGIKRLAPYTLHDMAEDSIGVLDALDIRDAHVVGVSMGGMISQLVAAKHPDRVKSFTAIMSTTNNPRLPQADKELVQKIFTSRSRPGSRSEMVDRSVEIWNLIGTPDGGNDPAEFRNRVAATIDRCFYPAGVRRQIAAILATGDLRPWTKKITAPSLVIHGSIDPLARPEGGRQIAETIDRARLEIIDGMGHDLPPKFLPRITDLVVDHVRSAEERAAATRAA